MKKKQKVLNSERTECEVYSRIVGYIRPVKNWNPGKTAEFHDRKNYDQVITKACGCN